jgi:hypothetical protein
MNCFIVIRVIHQKKNSPEIFIYADSDGNLPQIQIKPDDKINEVIHNRLAECFSSDDLQNIEKTKMPSHLEVHSTRLNIFYNFFCKEVPELITGGFIKFNHSITR